MIASLEGVRGIACVLVLLFHISEVNPYFGAPVNGYLAVDLFFVLSGFVIHRAYGARLADGADMMTFMVRRFGRLWPVHIATVGFFYGCVNLFVLANTGTWNTHIAIGDTREFVALATMTQGFNALSNKFNAAVSWSAGDEFYVYLLFGAVCLALRGKLRTVAFAALAIAGYAIALRVSLVTNDCLVRGSCFDLASNYGWARCLVGFFIGALLSTHHEHALIRALRLRAMQVAVFAVTVAFVLFVHRMPGAAFAAPLMFALFVASLTSDHGPVARLFQARVAQYFGKVSYSLYLGHGALLPLLGVAVHGAHSVPGKVAGILLFILASLILAHLLHRLVEIPFRARFHAWRARPIGLSA